MKKAIKNDQEKRKKMENAAKMMKILNYEGCCSTICTAALEAVGCLGQDSQTQSNPP